MKKLKIVLACTAGMSTELFCRKIVARAAERGFECDCSAYGVMALSDELLQGSDLLFLAPQVRFYNAELLKKYPYLTIEPISMTDYGRVNGEGVFDAACEKYGWE